MIPARTLIANSLKIKYLCDQFLGTCTLAASCKPRVAESGEQLAVYFRGSEYYLVRRVPRRRAVLLDRVQHIRNKQGTENMI